LHLEVHGDKWMRPGSSWGLEVVSPFINSMLYSRDIISLADIKFALNFIELRIRLNDKGSYNQVERLFV
jgi:hypothetical protein